jgi:hypothetical protein
MSNDETKHYDEDGAVAEAGADGVQVRLDARGVGIHMSLTVAVRVRERL